MASLMLEELNTLIGRELEFDKALVTLTTIEITDDLAIAHVKFSVLPESEAKKVLKVLQKFAGRLYFLLLKKLNIKPLPRLKFEIDRGQENAAEVEKLLLKEDTIQ